MIIFAFLLNIKNPLQAGLRAGVRNTAAATWIAAGDVGDFVDRLGGFSSRAALIKENETLKTEIARLESLSLHNDVLRSENAILRSMFSLREAHPEGIAAPMLSNPSTSAFGTFVIGSGTDDGIRVGAYVLSAPRVAIGEVIETDARTALVRIFSAPNREVEVVVNDTRATYVGKGDGNGSIVVPRGIAVEIGDSARLAGHPFAVGIVGAVQKNPEDSETTILVRVPSNLPALSFIYVVSQE